MIVVHWGSSHRTHISQGPGECVWCQPASVQAAFGPRVLEHPATPVVEWFFFCGSWHPQCSYPHWGRQSQCAVCTVGWWLEVLFSNHTGGMCEVHPGGDPIASCPTIQRPGGRRKEGQFAVVLSSGSGHPSCSGECLREGGSSVTRSVGQGRSRSTCLGALRATGRAVRHVSVSPPVRDARNRKP